MGVKAFKGGVENVYIKWNYVGQLYSPSIRAKSVVDTTRKRMDLTLDGQDYIVGSAVYK